MSWYMLTIVGEDRPGIVARITDALYQGGCNLGEASMMRLGGNFTIMLMLETDREAAALQGLLAPVTAELDLHSHIDAIEGHLHQHEFPDARVRVYGADRAGIVAQVTTALADAGLDILELESDVAGSEDEPIYIMQIEGLARKGFGALESAINSFADEGIDVRLEEIDTLIG